MSLFGSMLQNKVGQAADGLTKAVVGLDPVGAIQAQILEDKKIVDHFAQQAAADLEKSNGDAAAVATKQSEFDRYKQAARATNDKLQAGDATQQVVLDQLLAKAEGLKADIASLKERADLSLQRYNDSLGHHQQAIAKWTGEKERLEAAMRSMQNAQEDEKRAREDTAQRERDAGLLSGLNSGDLALSAMESRAAEARQRANAARMTGEALGAKSAVSSDVQKALDEVAGKPATKSAADRLADL